MYLTENFKSENKLLFIIIIRNTDYLFFNVNNFLQHFLIQPKKLVFLRILTSSKVKINIRCRRKYHPPSLRNTLMESVKNEEAAL